MSTYLDRFVVDSVDRPAFLAVRPTGIGASDAASYAKLDSVPLYVRAKLRETSFGGNAHTEVGHRWEGPAVAYAGFDLNTAMYHAVDETGFFATPDGIRVGADGALELAEAKTLLVRNYDPDLWVPHIPPAHERQMLWAQYVMGAARTRYVVLPRDENGTPLSMVPEIIEFPRDEDRIRTLLEIATPVLAAMRAARAYERTLTS